MGEVICYACDALTVACAVLSILVLRRNARVLRTLRAAEAKAGDDYLSRMGAIAEQMAALKVMQKRLEPFESLERYANQLRDANEVHRHRERVLVAIADAAAAVRKGARVVRDPRHATVHVKLEDYDRLCEALKLWGGTVIAVPGEVQSEKANNLSGPTEDPPEAA